MLYQSRGEERAGELSVMTAEYLSSLPALLKPDAAATAPSPRCWWPACQDHSQNKKTTNHSNRWCCLNTQLFWHIVQRYGFIHPLHTHLGGNDWQNKPPVWLNNLVAKVCVYSVQFLTANPFTQVVQVYDCSFLSLSARNSQSLWWVNKGIM